MVGSFGDVTFEVSETKVKTFKDLNFSCSVNYAEHKILNGNTLLEYTGKNAWTMIFKIELRRDMGVNPVEELEYLRGFMNRHEAKLLMIGEIVYGYFVIESMSGNFQVVSSKGEVQILNITLNLKESENE